MRAVIALLMAAVALSGCARYAPFNIDQAIADANRAIDACGDRVGTEIKTMVALALCHNDAQRRAFTAAPDKDLREGFYAERLALATRVDTGEIGRDDFLQRTERLYEQFALDLRARATTRRQDAARQAEWAAAFLAIQQAIPRPAPPIHCTTSRFGTLSTTSCY
jgi:hypothetical protein